MPDITKKVGEAWSAMSDYQKEPYQLQAKKVNLDNEIALAAKRRAFTEEKESMRRLIYMAQDAAVSSKSYVSDIARIVNEEVKNQHEPPVVKKAKVDDKYE
jgi:hypothetical protein